MSVVFRVVWLAFAFLSYLAGAYGLLGFRYFEWRNFEKTALNYVKPWITSQQGNNFANLFPGVHDWSGANHHRKKTEYRVPELYTTESSANFARACCTKTVRRSVTMFSRTAGTQLTKHNNRAFIGRVGRCPHTVNTVDLHGFGALSFLIIHVYTVQQSHRGQTKKPSGCSALVVHAKYTTIMSSVGK